MQAREAIIGKTYWFDYGDRITVLGRYKGQDERLKGHLLVRSMARGSDIYIGPETNLVEFSEAEIQKVKSRLNTTIL